MNTTDTMAGRGRETLRAAIAGQVFVPDEITSEGRLPRLPPLPELPEALRGRVFINFEAACLADAGTGAELIGPLRRPDPASSRPA
jgi:hypothetical protein